MLCAHESCTQMLFFYSSISYWLYSYSSCEANFSIFNAKGAPVQSVCNCTHNMQFYTQFAIYNCVRQLKRQGKTFFRVLWLDFHNLSRNVMIITTKYKLLYHGYSRCHCQCHQNVRRYYFIIKMDR